MTNWQVTKGVPPQAAEAMAVRLLGAFYNSAAPATRVIEYACALTEASLSRAHAVEMVGELIRECKECPSAAMIYAMRAPDAVEEFDTSREVCPTCQGTRWKLVKRGGIEAVERCPECHPTAVAEAVTRRSDVRSADHG